MTPQQKNTTLLTIMVIVMGIIVNLLVNIVTGGTFIPLGPAWFFLIVAIVIEIILLVAQSSGITTSRSTSFARLFPIFIVIVILSLLWFNVPQKFFSSIGNTHIASDTILYHVDWSKGLDGWMQVPGEPGDTWQITHNQLMNIEGTRTKNGIFLAPVRFGSVADYRIDVKMKIIKIISRVAENSQGTPSFGIIARWTGADHFRNGGTYFEANSSGTGFDVLYVRGLFETIGSDWTTYSFEVKQDHYKFTINSSVLLEYTERDVSSFLGSVDTSQAGQVGLAVSGMQVSISSFTVTAL